MKQILKVTSSPHIKHPDTTSGVMLDVIIALLPACAYGCIIFGWQALLLLATSVVSAVVSEYVWNLLLKKENTIGDLSAVVTGLLLGMNLPPKLPLWMAAIGSMVAIIVVKQMFGGIGCNFANPAITARIVLLVSFPAAMTSFIPPVNLDAVTSATPLMGATSFGPTVKQLFFGMHSGCIGETSAFLLLVGGIYLLIRRVISPIIPFCFVGIVALLTLISGGSVALSVFGGGIMLGAIFMATDYTTSPYTPWGKIIFGLGAGLLTCLIRYFGTYPEGVSFAILFMNILTPYISKWTRTKPFGGVKA